MIARRRFFDIPFATAVGILAICFVTFAVTTQKFASVGNMDVVFGNFVYLGLAALGLSVTMLAGEFNISFPSMGAVGGIIAMRVGQHGLTVGILVGLGTCLLIGGTQGLIIYLLRINSLVFTIGSNLILLGLANVLANEGSVASPNVSYSVSLQRPIWIFTPESLVAIAIFVGFALMLNFTRPGREILAVGGSRADALASGVPLGRPIVIAFASSGMLAGLAGGLVAATTGGASPIMFSDLLLTAVTAAFIGGVSLRGGRGRVLGVAIGVITVGLVNSGLALHGVQYYVEQMATAVILLAVVAVELLTGGAALRRVLRTRVVRQT